jgi:hypothetical protein
MDQHGFIAGIQRRCVHLSHSETPGFFLNRRHSAEPDHRTCPNTRQLHVEHELQAYGGKATLAGFVQMTALTV